MINKLSKLEKMIKKEKNDSKSLKKLGKNEKKNFAKSYIQLKKKVENLGIFKYDL